MPGPLGMADGGGLGIHSTAEEGPRAPSVQTDHLNFFLQDQVKMADFNAYNLENRKNILFSKVQLI